MIPTGDGDGGATPAGIAIFPRGTTLGAFPSRRSVVHSTKGMIACTQPLAAAAGQRILAEAAALNMTEPCSTGIGGDMFCLFYDAQTKAVRALNGSGRAPADATLAGVRADLGLAADDTTRGIPLTSAHAVTVPGAAAGWVDTVARFGSGKLSLAQVLQPAIELGEQGFVVSELTAAAWQASESLIRNASPNFAELLKKDGAAPDGVRAPRAGELMHNPTLAATFRAVGNEGKRGLYHGRVAEQIVHVVRAAGGRLSAADLAHHAEVGSEEVDPISLEFDPALLSGGVGSDDDGAAAPAHPPLRVWEHPPNGQGIVALMALGILQELAAEGRVPRFAAHEHNSTAYLHALIQALRIAFADARWWVADPASGAVPTAQLVSRAYLRERSRLFDPRSAGGPLGHGSPAHNHCDTVYFAVTDAAGNACSFIISNYAGFGTALVPAGCGFTLQNRGANFSLAPGHPNALAPRKRPYHTIIPALATLAADGALHSVFGVMGGFMQPQGHVQVLLNQAVFGYSPQEALDAPRFCIAAEQDEEAGDGAGAGVVYLEEGIADDVVEGLRQLGHRVAVLTGLKRAVFGRGQIIRARVEDDGTTVYSAGSDPRGDGAAVPAL
ncbi:hypothetical protein KEM52_002217 [Ascosphaera acerosa]|nr:hypothetical protein KEM52_002217 [Ascosphaera acerosa]